MEKSFILFLFLPLSEHTHFFLCLLTILFIPCPPKISTTKEKVMSLQVNWGVGSLNHSLPFLQKITKMKEENNISNLPHFPFFSQIIAFLLGDRDLDLDRISELGYAKSTFYCADKGNFSFRRLGEEGACWKLGNNCPVSIFNIPLFSIK